MAVAIPWNVNATFDPWTQNATILAPDGVTPFTFNIAEIMFVQHYVVYEAISSAMETGAALILLLTLLLITNKEKRRSLVFILNSLALLIIFIRGILTFLAYTGPFYNFYRWELHYYDGTRDAKNLSIAGELLNFLLICVIDVSLALQVRIVCCNLAPLQQLAINVVNFSVTFVVCGIRFALAVLNIRWSIDGLANLQMWQFETISRLASAANITFVVSVGISTVIFCAKLAFAITSRRSLGITQFGAMQIIFIMGCQTMCTPFIFTIITYWGLDHLQAALVSVPATIVALSLPLSAMWAAANTSNRHAAIARDRLQQVPAGRSEFTKAKDFETYTDTTASGTLVGDEISATPSPNKVGFNAVERDLEMQQVNCGGVQVDRTYSVRCD